MQQRGVSESNRASAHAENTKLASGDSATNGSYWYVVLHHGRAAAVYRDDGTYYLGANASYP